MRKIVALVLLLLTYSLCSPAQVQYSMSRAELEAKRKEIQNSINETERQLEAIKSDKKTSMGQLRALQNKLAERQRLIGNINDEMDDIDKDIRSSSREVLTLKQKLELMKMRYVQSIRYSYETRSSYDMLAFMFSSHDFNDAMRRMKYLKKFRDYRKQQVDQILSTQTQLQHKIGTLNQVKAQKEELVSTQVQQKQVLMKETDETNKVIQDLKSKESQLLKDIEKQRVTTNRINKAINTMIEQEMARATKAAEEAAKKNGSTPITATTAGAPTATKVLPKTGTSAHSRAETPTLMLTPTEVALAANFEENKGKLYWPVDKGYITDHFGQHPHPLAPQVMIENNGVDIQTDANAPVKAVFGGVVFKVFSTIGSNQIVMIKHGNFYTVYNGLATVSVKKDQQVNAKQVLGTVATNDEDLPVINFQIWKGVGKNNIKLNPEQWIGHAH
jgi:septal ring factor EnvC (AmiA/AmiB activator)